jgi:hypothetical protein
MRTICWYWLCSAGRSARISSAPSRFTLPESSSVPGPARTGSGSPVRADWSTAEVPRVTSPSTGTRSPGRMSRRSPTPISLTGTSSTCPSRSRRPILGARARSASSEPEARPMA